MLKKITPKEYKLILKALERQIICGDEPDTIKEIILLRDKIKKLIS